MKILDKRFFTRGLEPDSLVELDNASGEVKIFFKNFENREKRPVHITVAQPKLDERGIYIKFWSIDNANMVAKPYQVFWTSSNTNQNGRFIVSMTLFKNPKKTNNHPPNRWNCV